MVYMVFSFSKIMKYHYEKPTIQTHMYGEVYKCNHPVYNHCTLYKIDNRGLAVIQQYFDPKTKSTYWDEIQRDLTDVLYLHPKFKDYFDKRSGECVNGLYPTVTVRQIMWAFRMKPLPRERWETYFDRKEV